VSGLWLHVDALRPGLEHHAGGHTAARLSIGYDDAIDSRDRPQRSAVPISVHSVRMMSLYGSIETMM
jgi:hypothetical protein